MKKKKSRSSRAIRRPKKLLGVTLIELLTVMAFLSILIIGAIIMLKPSLVKAYDGQRKSDLKKIKNALEDYYTDYNCYPPAETLQDACLGQQTALSAYLRKLPCDPKTKEAYLYVPYPNISNTCGGYRVFTKLDNAQDKVIEDVHCDGASGCGLGDGFESYNFGVSEGVPLACDEGNCDEEGVREVIALLPTPTPPAGGGGGGEATPTPTPLSGSTPSPTPSAPAATPTPTPTPTPITYALNFTSVLAGGVISTSNTTGTNFANGDLITISAWVKPTELVLNRQEGILSKGRDDLPKNFRLAIVGSGDGVGSLGFYYLDSNNPAIAHQYLASSSLVENSVYFVAVTYQYGNPGSIKLYINGNQVAGSWTRGTGAPAPAQTSEAITIGGDTNANFNELFTGVIDQVRLYNTALSVEQISDQYNSGLGTAAAPETGLIAGWDLNEGSGLSIEDFSGNGRVGTLVEGSQVWVSGLVPN